MATTEKLANLLAKFSAYTVVLVGLPLIVFSGVEFMISEIEEMNRYGLCMQAQTLDSKVTEMSLKVCKH